MPDFGRWNANGGDPSLNEINRTDQFLDALAAQQQPYVTDREEAELAQLLAGWRDDVRETPMGHVLTQQEAAAALDRVTRPAPKRRISLAVVGSAAAAMLAIGGFGAVIAGSGPGDALYGLRTALFGEQAQTRDDAVILAAQTEMQQVQQLIEQGDWQGAQEKLQAVTTTVATVGDVEQKQELIAQWQELTVKVEAQDPVATVPPGAPLPTFPDIPTELLDPGTVTLPSGSETLPSDTSGATSPSSETTTAPSQTPTSPSSSPPVTTPSSTVPAPTSTTPPRASTTSPTTVPRPTTTSSAPLPTSTTVVVQSTTTTRAPLPTSTSAAAPSPTTQAPRTTPQPTVEEEPQPTLILPTTTTPVVLLPVPALPAVEAPAAAVPAAPDQPN
ncbi:anti-sigma-D factor RsdA [Mycolicibacterium sp. BiH015]|uniref:anti-sigma-D factor RsdA n=1 Tax=Mycolicibacterium sp. BiH015 TaxID=3018808 RepID=UPI0022E00896|nr:anti-sigma-D factor RsdA [Mycolicibacterium sp. BiH015]MDA2894725.1 anti-sigma-D factor RsdA [Mycolicibacterium sp. BiH015]